MKLTAVLIMPVNTKDRHQVFSGKDEVHLVKDLECNLLGEVAVGRQAGYGYTCDCSELAFF